MKMHTKIVWCLLAAILTFSIWARDAVQTHSRSSTPEEEVLYRHDTRVNEIAIVRQMTNDELSSALGTPIDKIEKWKSCFRAYREYGWRIRQWRGIVEKAIAEKKLLKENFEKIDFSLPDDPDFGDDTENEFFNPDGIFKATPIPQELIDELSSVKNSRLVFNLRRWFDTGKYQTTDLFSNLYRTDLMVIIPNFISVCPREHFGWNGSSFTKEDIYIAPDNHSIVEDKNDQFGYRISSSNNGKYYLPDGRRYYLREIAIRRSRK